MDLPFHSGTPMMSYVKETKTSW